MFWNIAQAKQHFSSVVKEAATEPQLIRNRNQTVAAVISAADYQVFEAWRNNQRSSRTLADTFAELRDLLREEGLNDGLEIPPRSDRCNPFATTLQEDDHELSG